MNPSLRSKRIYVTGAARGIGFACVRQLLAKGALIGATDIALTGELKALAAGSNERLLIFECDVSCPHSVSEAYEHFSSAIGPPNGLVCAAGMLSKKSLLETDIDLWRRTFSVNVDGSMLWMRAVAKAMIDEREGSIVLFASQLTRSGGRDNAAYVASKSAVIGLGRAAALELASYNIRVNTIVPGSTDTPMYRDGMQRFNDPTAAMEKSRLRHPMQRLATADEIANGVLFLLSCESGFATGAELIIDGGWTIG